MNKSISKKNQQLRIGLVVIITALSPLTLINSASADKGYRYWGYFQAAPGSNTWVAAMTGPTVELKDGAVEGHSFSISNAEVPAVAPSSTADFATLCADTPAAAGKIRVGLVINFGEANIAPSGEVPPKAISTCALVKSGATGVDVLNTAVTVRNDSSGLLCGIEGYPATECAPEVDMPIAQAVATGENPSDLSSTDEFSFAPTLAVALAALFGILLTVAIKKRKQL
ncbi:MAG: hypothetical protein F2658_01710 [Actinobacteria bacterium]|uniref:Unannotated protein n=1 Tax=freshwater metagenome TaxID=449393 RepID=A0A6J6N1W4_9ZZZZ|nr:hypothetical protein [Actinomycetota bacterium]